jgi:hypothetical protein
MSGDLLRTAVYANPNSSYFALAGSGGGGGGSPSTINTQVITTSTLTVNQPLDAMTGIILESAGGPVGMTMNALTTASLSVFGGEAFISATGDDARINMLINGINGMSVSLEKITSEETPAESKVGVFIDATDDHAGILNVRHINTAGEDGFVDVVGSISVGGGLLASTMSFQLKDGDSNALATVGFSSNGITSDSITTVPGANLLTQQLAGVNTLYRTKMFNNATVDMGQLMPMASVRNTTAGLEYASDSKIAQFGMMSTGSIFMPIPATTYASACNVVLAPYTVFELYTGPMGSGGSTVYNNSGNAYFSTFTAQPYLNGNTFNSYKMFFGN